MPSIRVVNVTLSVALVVCVGAAASLLCVQVYESTLDKTEESYTRGINASHTAGLSSTRSVAAQLASKTLGGTAAQVLTFLHAAKDFVEAQGTFVRRFPQAQTSAWEFADRVVRPHMFTSMDLLGGRGRGVITDASYVQLGGDPRGGAAGHLAGLRYTGPQVLCFREAQETLLSPPHEFHLTYVVENDGAVADWWEDGIWRLHGANSTGAYPPLPTPAPPVCTDRIAAHPVCTTGGVCSCARLMSLGSCGADFVVDGRSVSANDVCALFCNACPTPAPAPTPPPRPPPSCRDTLADSPACQFGQICTCEQLTSMAACGGNLTAGGQTVVVDELCALFCGACDAAAPPPSPPPPPPPPPRCADAVGDSPACRFGGVCTCEQLTAISPCHTTAQMAGAAVVINELCASFCGTCSPPSAANAYAVGITSALGRAIPPEPGQEECNLTRPLGPPSRQVSVGHCHLGEDAQLVSSGGWTVWLPHHVRLFKELEPERPHWVGLTGLGGVRVALTAGWCWTTDAYHDPVYGNRAGCVSASAGVDTISRLLEPQAQRDLVAGYRLYVVTRDYTAEAQASEVLPDPARAVHTDMLLAVSHGDAFVSLGSVDGMPLKDARHCTNATDDVIRAHCRHLLSLGDVPSGSEDGFDAAVPTWWMYQAPGAPAREYFQRIGSITDEAGLNLRLVILLPDDEVVRTVNEEVGRSSRDIAADRAETDKQREDGLVIMAVVVAVTSLGLLACTVVFTVVITKPFTQLRASMARVAVMDLEGAGGVSTTSSVSEIRSITESFERMTANLVTYRSYMPQSVFVQSPREASLNASDCDDHPLADAAAGTPRAAGSNLQRQHSGATASTASAATGTSTHGGPPRVDVQVRRRRLSLARSSLCDWQLFQDKSPNEIVCVLTECTDHAVTVSRLCNGLVDSICAESVCFSFGGASSNFTHRESSARAMRDFVRLASRSGVESSAVCSSGQALCGNVGAVTLRQFEHLGPLVPWLWRLSRHVVSEGVTVDHTVWIDARREFQFALTEVVRGPQVPSGTTSLYLLSGEQPKLEEEEWMYQLADAERKDPLVACNTIRRDCILSGDVADARVKLRAVLEAHEGDAAPCFAELQAQLDDPALRWEVSVFRPLLD